MTRKCHLNGVSLMCRWWPNIDAGLVALWWTLNFCDFSGGGGSGPPVTPSFWIRPRQRHANGESSLNATDSLQHRAHNEAHQRNAIRTAFRWLADWGPIVAHFFILAGIRFVEEIRQVQTRAPFIIRMFYQYLHLFFVSENFFFSFRITI